MKIATGILNPAISRVVSESGHTDSIVVADAGLPIPRSVERIDLTYRPGKPPFLDVLDAVLSEFVVERAVVAEEMVEHSAQMLGEVRSRLEALGVAVEFVPHAEFKRLSHDSRAIVRTGEFTPFSNVLLYSGVPF